MGKNFGLDAECWAKPLMNRLTTQELLAFDFTQRAGGLGAQQGLRSGLRASRGRRPEARGVGRRLQGALAAAPGGDNRAERPPQPEREPEPRGAALSWG
ncbi:unnamed protein product [Rangifer tarandus platyrhynchus]|uniref:Uncharacterized protein n=1 Tax=Rangifer tarandus platyrhynchus TaxID=3082113 RepID=A0AC59YZY2_RANTA